MSKLLFSLLFIIMFAQASYASEKAFSVMTSYGLGADDLAAVVKRYPELQDMDIAEDIQSFAEDKSHYILKLYAENTNDVYVLTKSEAIAEIKKFSIPFDMEIKTIQGDIHGTLFETLMKETSSVRISQQMTDAFNDDFTTTKGLRVNASYSFDVIQYYDNGRFIKYGSILKASLIIGHAMSNKILQMDPASNEWALLSDNLLTSDKPFYAPVRSRRVSSLFQLNRRHPVTRRHQPHNGIDFAASKGTAVYPALEGEVVVIARTRSKGKFITIQHDNGFETTYIHLNKFQKGLRVGMRVGLEDQIGEVGRTGYATGPHLHFGVIKDGYFINPIYLVKNYCYDQKDQFENLGFESEDVGIPDAEIPVNDSEE